MDRGAWQATVHWVTRVRNDLATKPPPICSRILLYLFIHQWTPRILHILALVHNAAMNMRCRYLFELAFSFSLGEYPEVELLVWWFSSQSYGFSSSHVWMWELDYKESWVPKNWCFWMVVLEKTLESPLDARRSSQSILYEISPGCSLGGLMLKLKLQYFGYLMRRADSLEKTLLLGKIEGRRRRGWQRMRWLDGITDLMNMSLIWGWTGRPGMLQSMGSQSWTQLSKWTELRSSWPLAGFFQLQRVGAALYCVADFSRRWLLLQGTGSRLTGSAVVASGLSWSNACGIFP